MKCRKLNVVGVIVDGVDCLLGSVRSLHVVSITSANLTRKAHFQLVLNY